MGSLAGMLASFLGLKNIESYSYDSYVKPYISENTRKFRPLPPNLGGKDFPLT